MSSARRFFKTPVAASIALAAIVASPAAAGSPADGGSPVNVDVSTTTGRMIEMDDSTGIAVVEGNAVVVSSTATMKADKIVIDNNAKTGHAIGHVEITQASGTITGREASYNWVSSTGTIVDAAGSNPPWRFWAEELNQLGPDVYEMDGGALTSCNHDPPHFRVRAGNGRIRVGQRAKMTNARLVLDDTPSFWFPFYTRSLRPKKYTLRIEPGSSGRDGFTNRTTIGYPFSQNTYTKFRWDFLEKTGNGAGLEHRYFNPNIQGDIDGYYIRDTNPDAVPESTRFSLLWNHFQRLTPRLTVNAKMDVKSDQTFGNQFSNIGNQVRVENQERGVFSEGGLNYQFPRAALQIQADRRDKFDSSVSSSNFIGKLTLPRITYNTIPLTFRYFPFYTSFNANFTNETLERTDPRQTLRYQRSAGGGLQIKKDIRVRKTLTITPLASYQQTWQDRDLTIVGASKDVYVGRYTVGSEVRKRVGRSVDTTFDYRYGERFERNRSTVDLGADDRGVETNRINASMVTRLGRTTRATVASGYDFRSAPRSDPEKYRHVESRISAPTVDVQYQATDRVGFYFRETYALYDPAARRVVHTPLNTSGEMQVGDVTGRSYFSQGFSYTKPSTPEAPSDLLLTNKIRFYPAPRWHLDFFVSYRATGPGGVNYRKVLPIEKTIRVARDLHCWIFRMEFSERPGRKEASFYIDLKANVSSQRNVFTGVPTGPESELDVSEIFPDSPTENSPE